MFIIWGTKVHNWNLGRAAQFCQRCVEIHPHRIHEVRNVYHIYFIPLGRGKLVCHEGVCDQCKLKTRIDRDEFAGFITETQISLEELITRTNPELPDRVAQWRDLQARMVDGEITDDERQMLLVNAITTFAEAVEIRAAQMHIDPYTALSLFGGLLLSSAVLCGLAGMITDGNVWITTVTAMLLLPILPTVYFALTDVRRFTRRKVIPTLADTLLALNPTRDELAQALTQVREAGLKIGKYVNLDTLTKALATRMAKDLNK